MSDSKFIKFFDKTGVDMNLESTLSTKINSYSGLSQSYPTYTGRIFFQPVSVDLIESQQIYLLQEVTGPTSSYHFRRIQGSVDLVGGSPFVSGTSTDFTSLQVNDTILIGSDTYTVLSIASATTMSVSPTPSTNLTTDNFYLYDFSSLNALRSSPDTSKETLNLTFQDSGTTGATGFFLYNVDYSENIPFIQKNYESSIYQMEDGSSDSIDPLTGRIQLSNIETVPLQINVGFTLSDENILDKNLYFDLERTYYAQISSPPIVLGNEITFIISGTNYLDYFLSDSIFYLQGVTAPGSTSPFYEKNLTFSSIAISGGDTYLTFQNNNYDQVVGLLNYSQYQLSWINNFRIATINLYGESVGEDERFRLVLENFGRQINFDQEYIFRESDINEDLPDYKLLNVKRKELLLAGDSIYPYMGSYKALINIINFFGYYDLRIKEYFLNVETSSSNYGKYMHLLIPKNEEQRELVKKAWEVVPSKIYKKTSLFGLFYDLNRATDSYDTYGIPDVEDAFDYSPEEVLIKLFGLKEILKKYFLPLNARIYDITGEGIYFERIRIDSWSDNLQRLSLDLGVRPEFTTYPKDLSYIADIRRIDKYYQNVFSSQGLTGFLGSTADDPYLTPNTTSYQISNIAGTVINSYEYFLDFATGPSGYYESIIDDAWEYMPPGISDPIFNQVAARLLPLPDDQNILSGAPILLEAFFDITWEDSNFTWGQLSILGPSGAPININIWTWDSLGRGEYTEMRWTVEKGGQNGFYYDTQRQSIDSFGVQVQGATAFSFPGKITVDVAGGSIVNVNLKNAGYGYTSVPAIYVPAPDQLGGTLASITCSISGGYINNIVFTPGSGYSYPPTITVEPPVPVRETTTKIYHAVNLPYEGEYQIGLYLYDITNNFSVSFQKYTVKNKQVVFSSIFRRDTRERTWHDFGLSQRGNNSLLPPDEISWDQVDGPWYYPIHVKTSWEDSTVSWETLNFSSYKDQSLYEYEFNSEIILIDRENRLVTLSGDQTGSLSNLITLDVGDYLFLTRSSNQPITDIKILPNGIDSYLKGLNTISNTVTPAYLNVPASANQIPTGIYNLVGYLNPGDYIFLVDEWYQVDSVSPTYFTIIGATITSSTNILPVIVSSNLQIKANVSMPGTLQMKSYSRILITENYNYLQLNPSTDFYVYLDGLTASGSTITMKGDLRSLQRISLQNAVLYGNSTLYASWGIFSGTYALEIQNISLVGGNTQFRLKDPNKELYYLDGNFTPKLADYDVDYAENRIGPGALTYQNSDEFTWSEGEDISWYTLEFHGGVLCGFTIPFVSPGGSITVDENPTFEFSGDVNIDSTKSGLSLAVSELMASTNEGISKYNYKVLPEDEIYLKDPLGSILVVTSLVSPGSTVINVNSAPGNISIPAELSCTVSGGFVTAVNIDNPGYGYSSSPIITVSRPSIGITAVLSCTVTNGIITNVTIDNPGSGYTNSPQITVSLPPLYEKYDNAVWTGKEWLNVISIDPFAVSGCDLYVDSLNYSIIAGDNLLLPYDYHKQILRNPSILQQFYFFIHATAKNPSNEMLSYIFFDNGVEGEWISHPMRTYSYPLRNSILYLSIPGFDNLTQDYLYNTWVYWGSDYPPLNIPLEYQSDIMSLQSRVPYSQTLQSAFSFIDTVISENQERIPQFTPVVFNYDSCRIPGKKNPIWTIYDEDESRTMVVSRERNLMWNFTRTGNFTVSLQIEDSNGNVSFGKKTSFIVVGDPSRNMRANAPLGRSMLTPNDSQLARAFSDPINQLA